MRRSTRGLGARGLTPCRAGKVATGGVSHLPVELAACLTD